MATLQIIRRGGFAGLKAEGTVDIDSLSETDRKQILSLFAKTQHRPAPGNDRYIYQLTLEDAGVSKQIEVPETEMPSSVANAVEFKL